MAKKNNKKKTVTKKVKAAPVKEALEDILADAGIEVEPVVVETPKLKGPTKAEIIKRNNRRRGG